MPSLPPTKEPESKNSLKLFLQKVFIAHFWGSFRPFFCRRSSHDPPCSSFRQRNSLENTPQKSGAKSLTQTLCACQQTYAAINIIMLMATARTVLAKRLVSNELRNVSFCLAKCAVLRAKTGHIAVQKRPFQGATWHLRKNKSTAAASSCISASMGKKLMLIYSIRHFHNECPQVAKLFF